MKRAILVFLVISLFVLGGCSKTAEETMERTKIRFETTAGNMEFELYDDLVPITAGNFKKLVSEGFYDGTRFHRVIKDFMIQGGDPLSKDESKEMLWGTGGPGYKIDDEFVDSLKHTKKGLLSMANSGPNTGGSQFFLTLVPTPWLDEKHAIFGEITTGVEIMESVGNTETDERDRPLKEVIINKASVI